MNRNIEGPFGDGYTAFFIVIVMSVFFALRPYFLNSLVYKNTFEHYFIINIFSYFFVLSYCAIVVDV